MKVVLEKMSPDGPKGSTVFIWLLAVFIAGIYVGARFF